MHRELAHDWNSIHGLDTNDAARFDPSCPYRYRHTKIDYDDGSVALNLKITGPLLGIGVDFLSDIEGNEVIFRLGYRD